MTQEELDVIIGQHSRWLRGKSDGKRAVLSHESLRGLSLQSANLSQAILDKVDLEGARLIRTRLCKASLHCAWLFNANLFGADLRDANLVGANLDYATLAFADLSGANLDMASCDSTNFAHAQLYGARLNAIMNNVNLGDARLDQNEQIRKGVLLKEPMVGYVVTEVQRALVTLEIPAGSIVFTLDNDVYRTNRATVVDIDHDCLTVSFRYHKGRYGKGDTIIADDFNPMYNAPGLAQGVQFYRTKAAAQSNRGW